MIHGIGIDIFDVARLERELKRENEDFLPHLFSPAEIEYGTRLARPQSFFARSFAAKEAVIKAIGDTELKGFFWRDLEVRAENTGYHVRFTGRLRELIEKLRIQAIHLTIEATDQYAIAVAVAHGSPGSEQNHG